MGNVKNIIIGVLAVLLIIAGIWIYFQEPEVRIVEREKIVQGKPDTVIIEKWKQGRTITIPPKIDTVTEVVSIDTTITNDDIILWASSENLKIEPLSINYYIRRPETIITRTDTITYIQPVEITKPVPFLESWWSGAIVGGISATVIALTFK